jgi:PHD/YefM family antitoxin component YafN of YafNO toxin-antitoxin module
MDKARKVQYITDETGKKRSVVLPVEDYKEMLEDIQDLVAIAERRDEKTVSLDELKKNLKADGLI